MAEKVTFQVRMIGDMVAPDTVRAGDLADLVSSLEMAIAAAYPEGTPLDVGDEAALSLVRIDRGSNRLTFAANDLAMISVGAISTAIASRQFDTLPSRSHEKIHEISRQASRRGWSIEIVGDPLRNISEALISPDRPIPPPEPATVSGPTSLWGHLMRVGGAKPKGEIRLPNGDLLYFDLTVEMARQLVDGLYEDVSIEGIATWEVESRKLESFKATRITPYRPGRSDLVGAFQELAVASRGRWDNVDAVRFVEELRSAN